MTVDAKAPPLGGAQAWTVWAIAVAFVIYYFSFQTGYSIVNPVVQKDVGLSVSQVGIVAATYTWVFAFCQFFSGALLDRLGSRRILLPCILLVTIGVFIFANATSFGMLLLSQLVIATGACAGFVGAGYVGGKWFGMAKFSLMFGLVQFAASLSSAFNQNFLNWALSTFHWRDLGNYAGVGGIMLLFVAWLWLRDRTPVASVTDQKFGAFMGGAIQSLIRVAQIPHIWAASAFGALCFSVMLALGVVWGPKLLMVRGLDASSANSAASFLWLGLAAGCFVTPWSSDQLKTPKVPVLIGMALQLAALAILLYAQSFGPAFDTFLCFLFGFGASAHMLAFSTAADIVEPQNIGTSAAFVNGMMFILGGVMISRPGARVGLGLDEGALPGSMELAQFAGRPLLLGLILALLVAALMRETYPQEQSTV